MGIRVSQIPEQYQNEFFKEVVKARGVGISRQLIKEDNYLASCFTWCDTEKGQKFWAAINEGRSPETTTTTSLSLKELVKEAKERGYKVGVMTEFGTIVKGFKHELLSDGDFYYRNVKVYSSTRGWAKIDDGSDEDLTNSSAIHAMIESILKGLRSN